MAKATITETVRIEQDLHQTMIQVITENPALFRSKNSFINRAIEIYCSQLKAEAEAPEKPPKRRNRK